MEKKGRNFHEKENDFLDFLVFDRFGGIGSCLSLHKKWNTLFARDNVRHNILSPCHAVGSRTTDRPKIS